MSEKLASIPKSTANSFRLNREERVLSTYRDPKAKLSKALDILDHYHEINGTSKLLNGLQKKKIRHGAKGIVRYAFQWITQHFSSSARNRKELLEKKVLHALDEVQRYHPVVSSGASKDNKKLLERALSIIQKHNQLIDVAKNASSRWDKKLLRFFINQATPSIKGKNRLTLKTPNDSGLLKSLSTFSHTHIHEKGTVSLSKQEEDAFRMKAISLIRQHGITFPSIEEALKAIQQSPIISQKEGDSVISLKQTVHPFPGEVLILKGAFKRETGLVVSSLPILERFEISPESSHTGFPCSSQLGWALSSEWIPFEPHHPEKIQLLSDLLNKKKKAAEEIRESLDARRSAFQLFVTAKKAAEENPKSFLALHKKLSFALLAAAPSTQISNEALDQISHFFSWLETSSSFYLELISTYQMINQLCFSIPFASLHKGWVKETDSRLFSDDQAVCLRGAKELLNQGWKKSLSKLESYHNQEHENDEERHKATIKKAFFLAIGPALAAPAQEVFLQYFSETIDYSPKPLSLLAKKLQSIAFYQQESFLLALKKEKDWAENPLKEIQKGLSFAIEHLNFQTPRYHPLIEMLDQYYNKVDAQIEETH